MHKDPAWTFKKWPKKEEDVEVYNNKIQQDKEKQDELIDTIKDRLKLDNLELKVVDAYKTVKDGRKIHFKYAKANQRTDEQNDVYNTWRENNPIRHVGPQHYFKMPKVKPGQKKKVDLTPLEDADGRKTYFSDRKITDKKTYKPMKGHLF